MRSFFLVLSAISITCVIVMTIATKLKVRSTFARSDRVKPISRRALWLSQARVSMSVHQFWIATSASALFTFALVSLFSRTPLVAVVVAIAAAGIPYMFIAKKRVGISRELINAWPDALRDISATISSGHSLSFALHSLAQVGPDCIAPHMARFMSLERTMGFVAALEMIRDEMNDATTDRVLEVLIVSHDRGSRVVKDIIDDLIEATTEDIALAETIATESLEMKINSRAVVVLPWCVLILLTLSGGVFRAFYQSPAGAVVIGIGALMSIAGIAILSRLTRTDLEARVFASPESVTS